MTVKETLTYSQPHIITENNDFDSNYSGGGKFVVSFFEDFNVTIYKE